MADHVHVLAAVRPSVSPSDFMKQLKGSSLRFISLEGRIPFYWQDGFGVFSVSEHDIDRVKAYVLAQKQHHDQDTIVPPWEETHEWNLGPASPGP